MHFKRQIIFSIHLSFESKKYPEMHGKLKKNWHP